MVTNLERAARIFKNGCDRKTNPAEFLFYTLAQPGGHVNLVCNLKKNLRLARR
jgi:hypothetical protein